MDPFHKGILNALIISTVIGLAILLTITLI
jgi:hypothetical protein